MRTTAAPERLGVRIRYDSPVDSLELRRTAVSWRHCVGGERIEAKACVLAAGGFESNPQWLREAWGQNERGEWPADNFLIRGTRFNQGVLLKHMMEQGADIIGDPSQSHCVAIDARAPLYDGGIVTRVDAVSLGVMVNREAVRFYDEGEDFWPKRYAIWGRLVALQPGQIGYCIIDSKAIGRFMPPVFPGVQADTLRRTRARDSSCNAASLHAHTLTRYNAACRVGTFDHTVLDDCHTEGLTPPKTHWARPIDTPPFYGYALRPGITFTYLGLKTDAHARVHFGGPAQRQPVRGRRNDGGQRARQGLHGRRRHEHRHRIRPHRRTRSCASAQAPMKEAPMQSLDALTRDAVALATGTGATAEVSRQMQICNACRYCETFCAVFPAMTRRLEFNAGDAHYLANLCHNCGACLHACQYAPPHEFAVNVPRAMAQVRQETYAEYAWPSALGSLYRAQRRRRSHSRLPAGLRCSWCCCLRCAVRCSTHRSPATSTRCSRTTSWSRCSGLPSLGRCWRSRWAPCVSGAARRPARSSGAAAAEAHPQRAGPDVPRRRSRRWLQRVGRPLHALAPAGSTISRSTASCCASRRPAWRRSYHYVLGLPAPYPVTSLPVLLGTVGGHRAADRNRRTAVAQPAPPSACTATRPAADGSRIHRAAVCHEPDRPGLLLACATPARWALLLAVHLGTVLALFLTLPYGKFAHAVYRAAALFKWAIERRQANRLQLGSE